MDKKFTINVPWYDGFNIPDMADMDYFVIATRQCYVNDLLKIHGKISLNEVLDALHVHKRYSYRWGYDYTKGDVIEIKVIKNPSNPKMRYYLRFTARDIVS